MSDRLTPERLAEIAARAKSIAAPRGVNTHMHDAEKRAALQDVPALLAHAAAVEVELAECRNLIAVGCRDGGQYMQEHGLAAAVVHAEERFQYLTERVDTAEADASTYRMGCAAALQILERGTTAPEHEELYAQIVACMKSLADGDLSTPISKERLDAAFEAVKEYRGRAERAVAELAESERVRFNLSSLVEEIAGALGIDLLGDERLNVRLSGWCIEGMERACLEEIARTRDLLSDKLAEALVDRASSKLLLLTANRLGDAEAELARERREARRWRLVGWVLARRTNDAPWMLRPTYLIGWHVVVGKNDAGFIMEHCGEGDCLKLADAQLSIIESAWLASPDGAGQPPIFSAETKG